MNRRDYGLSVFVCSAEEYRHAVGCLDYRDNAALFCGKSVALIPALSHSSLSGVALAHNSHVSRVYLGQGYGALHSVFSLAYFTGEDVDIALHRVVRVAEVEGDVHCLRMLKRAYSAFTTGKTVTDAVLSEIIEQRRAIKYSVFVEHNRIKGNQYFRLPFFPFI